MVAADWIGSCKQDFLEDDGLDRMRLACGSELLGGSYGFDLGRGSVYDQMERKDELLGSNLVDTNAITTQPSSA